MTLKLQYHYISMLLKKNILTKGAAVLVLASLYAHHDCRAAEPYSIDWHADVMASGATGQMAPYYMASNRHGILTQGKNAILNAGISRPMDLNKRFSYGFALDFLTGYSNSTDYLRFSDEQWVINPQHPSRIWLQQLYGEIKYRSLFLTVGLKKHQSALLNFRLSSGDLTESGNARPIPEVRAGFIDFQDIPFTNGWIQIQGEISYGKFTDNKWIRNHFNHFGDHINQGALYSYKRCYFRTKPSMPFSATLGMQVGAIFGGTSDYYMNGHIYMTKQFSRSLKQCLKMLIPTDGGQEYYSGSTLGSWDILLRYRLPNSFELKGYMQKPWEDGSGIGFLNGFDGLWGLELATNRKGIVSGAVVEYIDFTNQSGPTHWDPDDFPGTTATSRAEGGDNYYNNHEYNGYQNYGMSIGTPFNVSPIYNRNGTLLFNHNLVRGFHIGVEGNITGNLDYRLLGGYRKSWGTDLVPLIDPETDTSFMAEVTYNVPQIKGLKINAQFALDHGKLYGNNTGGCVTVSYSGLFNL